MLNSRPTVSSHKRKVAPITSRSNADSSLSISLSICLSVCPACLSKRTACHNLLLTLNLVLLLGLLQRFFLQVGHVCDFHFNWVIFGNGDTRLWQDPQEPQALECAARTKANLWFGANEIQTRLGFHSLKRSKEIAGQAEPSHSWAAFIASWPPTHCCCCRPNELLSHTHSLFFFWPGQVPG